MRSIRSDPERGRATAGPPKRFAKAEGRAAVLPDLLQRHALDLDRRGFEAIVERVDFVTSFGFGDGGDHRRRLGIETAGPSLVITDLCVMRPDPATKELVVSALHPGVVREQVEANTGWPVRFADPLDRTPPPTEYELSTLRGLKRRTADAHAGGVIPSERSESRGLHPGAA